MTQKREQIPYLHILRIIAILMVIMLHSVSPYISNAGYYGTNSWYVYLLLNAVSRGGVPLFFMISGYLLLSDSASSDFKSFYSKRLPRILVPLACWNVLYYIFYCVFNKLPFDISEFFAQFINCGTAYHLWYIYTLFGIYLLVPFIKRITDSCTLRQLAWLVVLICFCPTVRPFINTVTPMYIYLFDPLFNGYLGYFVLGYILGKAEFNSRQTAVFIIWGIAAVVVCVLGNNAASTESKIDLVFNSGYNICFYAIGAAFFCGFKKIRVESEKTVRVLKHFSKATFGMYFVHVAVMEIITSYFMPSASPIVCTLYLFAVTLPFAYLLSLVVGKIKYLS